jgi:hypothetical protein
MLKSVFSNKCGKTGQLVSPDPGSLHETAMGSNRPLAFRAPPDRVSKAYSAHDVDTYRPLKAVIMF